MSLSSILVERFKNSCYFILNLLTLGKGAGVTINGHSLRLPMRYHKYFPSDYERSNFFFFKSICKPGMTCLDIGAHIGLFSTYMQQVSNGQVFSFEPTPSTVTVLKKTIILNHLHNKIIPVPAAVSDTNGKARFNIHPAPVSVSNSLVQYYKEENLKSCEVEVTTIDNFVNSRKLKVDFIKIDGEGAELSILKGGHQTITSQRPFIILALHPEALAARKETNEMIWLLLQQSNYIISHEGEEMSKQQFCEEKEMFDVHLVPAEKAQ